MTWILSFPSLSELKRRSGSSGWDEPSKLLLNRCSLLQHLNTPLAYFHRLC